MNIILTGASGQVGREIKAVLLTADNFSLTSLSHQNLDITSMKAVRKAFKLYQPDIIINAAAYTAVDRAEQEPEKSYSVNVTGARVLAQECSKINIPLIHISTDYVFDGSNQQPYTELDHVSPLNIYGKTKWDGEDIIRKILSRHIIIRTSWVFAQYGKNFVNTILHLSKVKSHLSIVSDQYGCPTAAPHIATAIFELIA